MKQWLWITLFCTACVQSPVEEGATRGRQVYVQVCAHCHDSGRHGAQRIGDREGWKSRLGQGLPVLIEHSIRGYEGAVGHMPPRGGDAKLSDADVAAAVSYLLEQSR